MWVLLHGGGARASRHLQCHPHHLPAQTGRSIFLGLCQHFTPQGLPAPVKVSYGMTLKQNFGSAPTSHGDIISEDLERRNSITKHRTGTETCRDGVEVPQVLEERV